MELQFKESVIDSSHKVIISVVVPTYNRGMLIHRAIDSIKKQTFKHWECIIVDDCSTDNTIENVNNLIGEDKRFSIISYRRKKGAPGARNSGILIAKGEFVVLFDSDNAMHPEFLEKVYNKIKMEHVDVCASFSNVIDENTGKKISEFKWIGYGYVHDALFRGRCYFDNSSTMIKKQKLIDIGLLDEDCPSFQEWETHIRLSKIATYSTVEEELIDYYRGGTDTISKSQARAVSGRLYVLNKFKNELIKEHFLSYLRICLGIYTRLKEIEAAGDKSYLDLNIRFRNSVGLKIIFLISFLYNFRRIIKWSHN